MLEKATIARPYAEAAFAHALEEGKLADWSAMLNLLSVVINNDSRNTNWWQAMKLALETR